MSTNASGGDDLRVRFRTELLFLLSTGVLLGIWHAQMATRAVFTFRNDEPYTSWIGIFAGPLSTLPAVALALYRRRWSALWLIGGGAISLIALSVKIVAKGNPVGESVEFLTSFLLIVVCPMVALGLGLFWIDRRLKNQPWPYVASENTRHLKFLGILCCYVLLSFGAFFAADFPLFKAVLDTRWSDEVLAVLLGPLMTLATARFIGLPIFLAESVVVLGLLWLAIARREQRRAALFGALAAWIGSGLIFLAIMFAYS
jgi:hypothetical protein